MTSAQLQGKNDTTAYQTSTLATSGNLVIDSAQDSQSSDRHNLSQTHVATQSSTTTQASRIDGATVTLVGGNIGLSATDIQSSGKTQIAAAGNLILDANTDSQFSHTLEISESGGFFSDTSTTDERTRQSQTARVTTLTAGQLDLQAGNDIALVGSTLKATDGSATLTAGGKISAYAIQNQSYTNDSHESSSSFLGYTYSHQALEDSVLSQTARVTELNQWGQTRLIFVWKLATVLCL